MYAAPSATSCTPCVVGQYSVSVGSITCTSCSTGRCTTIGSITSSPSSPSKVDFNMTILDGDGNPVTAASPFVVGLVYVGLFGGFVLVSGMIAVVTPRRIGSCCYSSHPRCHFEGGRFFEQTRGRTILLSGYCRHLGLGWCDFGDSLPIRRFHLPRENGTHCSSARNSLHQQFLNILCRDHAFALPGPLSDTHHLQHYRLHPILLCHQFRVVGVSF